MTGIKSPPLNQTQLPVQDAAGNLRLPAAIMLSAPHVRSRQQFTAVAPTRRAGNRSPLSRVRQRPIPVPKDFGVPELSWPVRSLENLSVGRPPGLSTPRNTALSLRPDGAPGGIPAIRRGCSRIVRRTGSTTTPVTVGLDLVCRMSDRMANGEDCRAYGENLLPFRH